MQILNKIGEEKIISIFFIDLLEFKKDQYLLNQMQIGHQETN